MERCAYCGEKVGDDGLYVDDEIFCSDECMRDFGAGGGSEAEDDDEDLEEDDDSAEESDDDKKDDDDY